MSQAVVLKTEKRVEVTRDNSSSIYYTALASYDRVVATGSCGVGKSTYALLGLLSVEIEYNVLVVQPNTAAVNSFQEAYARVAATEGYTVVADTTVRSAEQVVDRVLQQKSYLNKYDLVVVDEFHLSDPYVAAVTQLVRDLCNKYVLISATLVNDSCKADAKVKIVAERNASAEISGDKSRFEGTVYDPVSWSPHIKSVVIYPMTQRNVVTLTKLYKARQVRVVDDVRGSDRQVIMLRAKNDVGRTINADMLIDSGYIESESSVDRVFANNVRPLTDSERIQRWSRVGRIGYDAVIVHAGRECASHVSDWERETTAVLLKALDCDKVATRNIHGIKLNHYSKDFAVKAVKSSVDTLTQYNVMLADFQPILYSGPNLSLPCLFVDNTGGARTIRQIKCGSKSGMSFDRAKTVYAKEPRKYYSALFALLYGDQKYAKCRISNRYKDCVNVPSSVLKLTDDEIKKTRLLVDYEVEGSHKVYSAKVSWSKTNKLNHRDAYSSGKPQQRFAEAVSFLRSLPQVDYKYSTGVGTVHDVLSAAPLSGGDQSISFTRLSLFAKKHGCAVTLMPIGHFDPAPKYSDFANVSAMLYQYRNNCQNIVPIVLAARYMWSSDGTIVVDNGGRAKILGVDVYVRNPDAHVDTDDYSELTVIKTGEKYEVYHCSTITAELSHDYRNVRKRGAVKTNDKTDAQRLLDWYCNTGIPFMMVRTDLVFPDDGIKWMSIDEVVSRQSKLSRHSLRKLKSPVLMVSYELDGDGTFKVNGSLSSIAQVALVMVPDTECIMDQADVSVHCNEGVVVRVKVAEPSEGSLISSCEDFVHAFRNKKGKSIDAPVTFSNGSNASSIGSPISSMSGGGDTPDNDPPIAEPQVVRTVSNKQGVRRNAPIAPTPQVKSTFMSGGNNTDNKGTVGASTASDDMVINLTGDDVINATAVNDAGNMLSKEDFTNIDKFVTNKYTRKFYVSLLDYLIKTDASSNVSPTAATVIDGKTHLWQQIFAEIQAQCRAPAEFHIRKYARSLAASLIKLWVDGKHFQNMRESVSYPLRGRAGLNDIDTIYTLSFTEHLIPGNLRGTVAKYHQSRKIRGTDDFHGAIKNFTAQTSGSSAAQGGTENIRNS